MALSSRLYQAYSSSSDDESEEMPKKVQSQRFIMPQSDSEDEKRVVRSAKDKRHEEMTNLLRSLNNHKKIKDMSRVETAFDELVKLYEKALKMNEIDVYPTFYIRMLAQMEDFVNESWSEKKTLSKVAAKSLTILRQKIRKYIKEFEEPIKKYRENPVVESEPEDELGDTKLASSESEEGPVKSKTKPVVSKSFGSDSDDDTDDFFDSSDDSDSSDAISLNQMANPADYFLKDPSKSTKDKKPKKESRRKPAKQAVKPESGESDFGSVDGTVSEPVVQAFEKGVEVTEQLAMDKIKEILANRGKRTCSISEQNQLLDQVCKKIEEMDFKPSIQVKGILSLITVIFDYESKHAAFMPVTEFQRFACFCTLFLMISFRLNYIFLFRAIELMQKVFEIIDENPDTIEISETFTEETESIMVSRIVILRWLPISSFIREKQLGYSSQFLRSVKINVVLIITTEMSDKSSEPPYRVRGSLLSNVSRLDDEYFKILQNANGHEMEYDERLRDEPKICKLIDQLIEYLKKVGAPSEALCKASLHKVEHMYYKFDYEWGKKVEEEGIEAAGPNPNIKAIETLCHYIYKYDTTDRMRTRAILCHIYFLALHDQWHSARELMLMSNLQATIDHADLATMILFNRAMVQLGMCAFRQGHIKDAHSALCDLTGTSRVRELLAQGQRFDRTKEDEKRDKALQMPYHMHINTELIETVFLICAMLIEIPLLAASQDNENRTKVFSKAFMTVLRIHDRSSMTVPPESPRDHVLAASKALRHGDWKKATQFIFSPKMNAKIWILFYNASAVKEMVEEKVKEECLRCYLFTYAQVHESISLQRLAEHFDFPRAKVYSIISKMIINQELAGSLEVPADFLTIHKGERSRFQILNIQLADKINSIVEMNEKLIDSRGGQTVGNKGGQNYQGRK
ncbi:unnamed protein product [Rodentolepis nana]|uniref:Eukaryotic translation initiation factor 3 subunit C n=1 Tax=Rodentolepis nana TaxID=102285 RepID=A0A158QI45_RODNA|nr:unnamed protein product [Rodentolepis nana]